jgi:hypothetical protein
MLPAAFSEMPVVIDPIQLKQDELQRHPILRQQRRAMNFLSKVTFLLLLRILPMTPAPWISAGSRDKLPWAGNFKGRQEIADQSTDFG